MGSATGPSTASPRTTRRTPRRRRRCPGRRRRWAPPASRPRSPPCTPSLWSPACCRSRSSSRSCRPGRGPVPHRPRGGVGGRRGRLRQPLGELLLRRAHAPRQGARHRGGRRRRLPGPGVRLERGVRPAYVLLEDGTRFDGDAVGAPGPVTGEVVFTTGMSGYQESMSDPSFARQLITFTYPHIGNYGVSAAGMESDRIHARAAIMREAVNRAHAPGADAAWLDWLRDEGVPGITGVDTRSLVRHIRDAGAMRGGVFPGEMGEGEARERIAAEPSMVGRDLAREVTIAERRVVAGDGDGPRIAALDTGIKHSIVRNFTSRGATLELFPCTTTADELLASDPDGVFLVPGPGDPAALGYVVETVRALIGRKPVFGICLGHQLLSRAVGLETFKLP